MRTVHGCSDHGCPVPPAKPLLLFHQRWGYLDQIMKGRKPNGWLPMSIEGMRVKVVNGRRNPGPSRSLIVVTGLRAVGKTTLGRTFPKVHAEGVAVDTDTIKRGLGLTGMPCCSDAEKAARTIEYRTFVKQRLAEAAFLTGLIVAGEMLDGGKTTMLCGLENPDGLPETAWKQRIADLIRPHTPFYVSAVCDPTVRQERLRSRSSYQRSQSDNNWVPPATWANLIVDTTTREPVNIVEEVFFAAAT